MTAGQDSIGPAASGLGWRFAVLFALYSGGLLLLLQLSPLPLIQDLAEATASATALFWNLFSVPLVRDGFFLSLGSFPMEVTLECTAAHYIVIMTGAVMAYPAHSLRYKAAGLAALIACVLLLNIARIGILGLVGLHAASWFGVVHTVVWQGLFALLVVGLWILWVQGRRHLSNLLVRRALPGLAAAIVSYILLSLTLPYYVRLLAAAAHLLHDPLSMVAAVPAATRADGPLIAYQVRGGWATYRISADIMNTMAFCTLLAVSTPLRDVSRLWRMALAGFGMLFLLHAAYVVMFGMICAGGIDENTFGDLTRGFAFISPLIVWFLVMKIFRGRTTS